MEIEPHASTKRTAIFRFYEELNDYLPQNQQRIAFSYSFIGTPAIKDTIEAIGVPHSEIDLILVDGKSVDFNYQICGNEKVAVYPVFESFDIGELVHLRAKPLRETKFVVDVNLGKLAKKLRILGFDTLYRNDLADAEIVAYSTQQQRIILTRDKGILKYRAVTHGYWVRNQTPAKQLSEVISRLQLQHCLIPFTRCSKCNGLLHRVDVDQVRHHLSDDNLLKSNSFMQCMSCHKFYWQGSHYRRIWLWVNELAAL